MRNRPPGGSAGGEPARAPRRAKHAKHPSTWRWQVREICKVHVRKSVNFPKFAAIANSAPGTPGRFGIQPRAQSAAGARANKSTTTWLCSRSVHAGMVLTEGVNLLRAPLCSTARVVQWTRRLSPKGEIWVRFPARVFIIFSSSWCAAVLVARDRKSVV